MTTTNMTDSKPWYKQFWPWFVIALPMASVAISLTLVYYAVKYKVSLVRENWYKDGVAINVELDEQKKAKQDGLKAFVTYTAKDNTIMVRIKNLDTRVEPELTLDLIHPTLEKRDQTVELVRTPDNAYFAKLTSTPSGFYYTHITSEKGHWEIDSKVNFSNPLSNAEIN